MAAGSALRPAPAAVTRPPTPLPPLLPLATPIQHSSDVWQGDLRGLFEHAKERFGDVTWQVGQPSDADADTDDDGAGPSGRGGRRPSSSNGEPLPPPGPSPSAGAESIWGHKAIIYARAPPAFQARYFPPSQLRAPSPLGQSYPNGSSSTAYLASSTAGSSLRVPSSVSLSSTLSAQSSATLRPPLHIRVDVTPQMFKAELEWLYTGEGMGEVVEWLNQSAGARTADGAAAGGGGGPAGGGLFGLGVGLDVPGATVQEVGRIEGPDDHKCERLRTDLVYMWRSKLFSDVKLVLPLDPSAAAGARPAGSSVYGPDHSPNDQSLLEETTATTATFTTHKFILASRSPYFAQLLLNPGGFRSVDPAKGEIKLPSPPFTPASMHFCLGFMYAGTLAFSNRKHDLQTAFQIHRSASYLQMSSLRSEIESRIVHEMCDSISMDRASPPSKLTCRRVPRVWRFAAAPDVGAHELEQRCREWVVLHWGECWGREVGSVGKRERDALVKDTLALLRPDSVVSFYRGLLAVRARTEVEVRTVQPRGLKQTAWSDNLLGMVLELEQRIRAVFVRHLEKVVESEAFAGLLDGRGFEHELLEKMMDDLPAGVAGPESCKEAARVYQVLVNSLMLKIDPSTSEPALAPGSENRLLLERTRVEVVKHIRRRWMQIREKGGFEGLEAWALKEISDDIDQPVSELLAPSATNGKPPLRRPPVLTSSVSKPRLSDSASVRSSATSVSARTVSTTSARKPVAPQATASQRTLSTASSVRSTASSVRPAAVRPAAALPSPGSKPRASEGGTSVRSSPGAPPGRTISSTSSKKSIAPPVGATPPRPSSASSSVRSRPPQVSAPPRPPSAASSVRSTASTLRRSTASPATPVPKLPAAPIGRTSSAAAAAATPPSRPSPSVPRTASLRSTQSSASLRTTPSRVTPACDPKKTAARLSSPSGSKPPATPIQQVAAAEAGPSPTPRAVPPPAAAPPPPASPATTPRPLPAPKESSETSDRSVSAPFVLASAPPSMMRPARYNPAAAFEPPRRVPVRKVPSRETFVPHDVATLEPAAAETGVSFNVGIPVLFYALGRSKPNAYGRAFVRYIGRLAGEKGPWVGLQVVEDDIETVFEVHRDGTFRGVKYFEPGDEDEDNWHGSRRFIEGERRRKTSGTSSGTSESSSIFRPPTHSTNGHARMPSLGGRPCIFVRPVDVAWVNSNSKAGNQRSFS